MTFTVPEATRVDLDLDGRRLSFLDFGGPGRPLPALHGHFSEARTFARLARELAPDRRVIAPDQRGHGESDRASDYHRRGYLADTLAVLDHLGLGPVVVLGHPLGGVNAYQLAAHHPDRVRALIVEDVGAVVEDDLSFCLSWPHRAPDREALVAGLGAFRALSGRRDPRVRRRLGAGLPPGGHGRLAVPAHGRSLGRLAGHGLSGSPRARCPQRHPGVHAQRPGWTARAVPPRPLPVKSLCRPGRPGVSC
ncbi:alpha/beta fold hydrolase [Streptomyces cyaneofuscatus]|uniref:alpha/beta fold hydrolase n=1 Tax=Streptomyces cyaneofuscatus TaxID=66883 RepID=UPI003659A23F